MRHRAFFAMGLSLLAMTAPALCAAREKTLPPVRIDPAQVGTPPDAATQSSDLATVLSAQAGRTPAREQAAIEDSRQTLARFLGGMGIAVDKDGLKKARRLFKEATQALEAALAPVKERYERPRPFKAASEVKTCPTSLPKSSSFPSTHAGTGTLFAALLAHVAPERKAALEERGLDYGWSRVVCGLHYPSDVEAGRKGGRLVAAALLNDRAFVARLDAAAPALRRALGL